MYLEDIYTHQENIDVILEKIYTYLEKFYEALEFFDSILIFFEKALAIIYTVLAKWNGMLEYCIKHKNILVGIKTFVETSVENILLFAE